MGTQTNTDGISTLGTADDPTGLVDGTDSIHAGILNALNQQSAGSFVAHGLNVIQNGSTFTVTSGGWFDEGEYKTTSVSAVSDTLNSSGAKDHYAFLVIAKGTTALSLRTATGSVSGANTTSSILVASLTAGDIPVCLVKVLAGASPGARPIQFYGIKKLDSKFTAVNNSTETMRINKEGTFVKAGNTGTISLPSVGSTNATLLSTHNKGISDGNILEANANVADNDFLRVDGTKIEGRTAAQMKTDLAIGLTDVSGNLDDISDGSNHKKIPTADATKISNLTVGGAIDLDAIKVKADRLTISQNTDLDSIKTKADRLTISANTDLDAIKVKADHLTITGAIDLDSAVLTDTQLTASQINAMTINANTVGGFTVAGDVGKAVPSNAVFTDTQRSEADINAMTINANTVNSFTVAGNVEKAVPSDAVFTDTNTQRTNAEITALADASAASIKQGLDTKDSVRVATTNANITLSGTQTIDGVSVIADNRVLVKNQTDAEDNGIYLCKAGAWTRATDADANADVTAGLYVWVEEGTLQADTGWILSNTGTIVVGTTDLSFTQFSGAGQINAGSGLVKSGNTINLNVDNSSVEINSDAIRIKATGITNDMLAGSIANAKLVDIAQSKITGLTTSLNSKVESLSDLSITASVSEINILDGGLSATDIPNLNASKINAGTLPVARGGTNLTSLSTLLNANVTASDVGLGNVLNQPQIKTFKQDGIPTSTAIGDQWYDTNDSNKLYVAESVGADQVTSGEWVLVGFTKTTVGLSNLDSLESGTGTKLAGIQAGATDGASASQVTAINANTNKVSYTDATIVAASKTVTDKLNVSGLSSALDIDALNDKVAVNDNKVSFEYDGASVADLGTGGDIDNDIISIYDTGASAYKKVKMKDFLTKITANQLVSGGSGTGTVFSTLPASGATVGSILGTNMFDADGSTALTATIVKNANTNWADVAGTANAPANNATVGAVLGSNIFKSNGSTIITANELLNTNTEYDEINDANNTKPADNATVGARLGTNLKAADGSTTLGDDDVKNASITLTKSVSGNTKTLSLTNANAATTTLEFEDGATKTQTFRSDNPPTAVSIGDLWVDTNDGNKVYSASATGTGDWNLVTASYTATEKTKLSGIAANATASTGDVTLTGIETLTNKTLTSPKINVGSDAGGDIYYRDSSGNYARLQKGTEGQVLGMANTGLPAWQASSSGADAMGAGFTVSATTDTNATTITVNDDLFFAAGTGITTETTADGTVTITNTVTNTDTQLSDAEVETAYNNQVSAVSTQERTNGSATAIRRFTPADIHSMIDTHQTDTNTDVTVANLITKLGDISSAVSIGDASDVVVTIPGSLVVTGTTTTANVETTTVSNGVIFESNATGSHTDKETKLIGVTGLTGDVTITLPSADGTLARTADVAYSSAISEGNSGLVPSVGTDGYYLAHNGAFAQVAYSQLSGTPTIPSGNAIIDWTGASAGTIHASNYSNTQLSTADVRGKISASGSSSYNSSTGVISSTDTNTFRTIELDTNGNNSANNTLGATETLRLKKGSNITLTESGGVVTISSTDTNTDTNTQLDDAGVTSKVLTGLSVTATTSDVTASNTILEAIGHMEKRIRLNDDKVTNTNTQNSASTIRTLIGSGNNGHVPTTGTSGHFLAHDGVFRALSISNAQLAGSITNDKISSVNASTVTSGTLPATRIGADSINSTRLQDDAVIEAKIADDAVTGAKVSGFAVANAQIGAGSLALEINASATALTCSSQAQVDTFPTSGVIEIGSEKIKYTGKTSLSLTGLVRGHKGTTAASHNSNATFKTEPTKQITLGGSRTLEVKQFEGADSSNATDLTGGLVPYAGTGDTAKFLRGDGAWSTPSGGDTNAGGVNGSASAPTFSFASDSNNGLYLATSDQPAIAAGGLVVMQFGVLGGIHLMNNNRMRGGAGSAGNPTYGFIDDGRDNGMYKGGTDILGFSTAGTERMTISASGVVNITGSLTVGGSAVGGASSLSELSDVALVSNSLVAGSPSASMSGSQFNAGFGRGTLGVLSSGDNNSAIGFNALGGLNTGSNNTANGYNAGATITSGSRNTVIGYGAGDGFDTENDNIAIGFDALGGSVAGSEKNVIIGNYAGDAIQSGGKNSLYGYDAGSGLTTGHSNTFLGAYSGKDTTNSQYNVAVGYGASQNNAQGGRVTSIGGFAGQSGDGNYTVYVGYAAGQYSTGESNTFIGDTAGQWTSGDKNIAIGHNAQGPNLSGDGNVIIGYDTDAPSNSGDRQLIIAGNDGTTATTWITGSSTGLVDIPTALEVGTGTQPLPANGVVTIINDDSDTTKTLLLVDNESDATNGPVLTLYRNTASPANNDVLGKIELNGEDNSGNPRAYGSIRQESTTVGDGSHDGTLFLNVAISGTQTDVVSVDGTGGYGGLTHNPSGIKTLGNVVGATSTANNGYITLLAVPHANFKAIKASVHITDSSSNEVQTMDVMCHYDGSAANYTSYGIIFDGAAAIGEIEVDINSSNIRIRFKNTQGATRTLAGSIHAVCHP